VILANAVSYVAPVLSLRSLDPRLLHTPDPVQREPGQIRAGLRYVRGRPDLMLVLAIVFFTGTFGLNFQLTSALMATEVFGKGATEYGLLGTFMAVGSLAGALLAARRVRVRQRLIVLAALTFAAVEIVAGSMPTYVTFAMVTPLLGLSALTMITAANTFMQLNTDPGMRGRVMALYLMIFIGGTPLGAPFIGWIGEVAGARWTLWIGGLATAAGVLAASAWYLRTRPTPEVGRVGAPREVAEAPAAA
jgi:predicted MFS family arabinose efflux permease